MCLPTAALWGAANWWKASGTQEGCHFEHATQAAVLPLLRAALDARGLSGVRIAASDESQVDMAVGTWAAFNATTRGLIDEVNVHGYQDGGDRAGLYNSVVVQAGKTLRMSEHGDGDASGWNLATQLHADFAALHPTSWVYWQALDAAGGWTLVNADMPAGTLTGGVPAKYYALAQWSRHIRPNATILATADAPGPACTGGVCAATAAAALDAKRGVLTVVATNVGSTAIAPGGVVFDLSAVPGVVDGPVPRWATQPQAANGDRYRPYIGDAAVKAGQLSLSVAWQPGTVVTFEVPVKA